MGGGVIWENNPVCYCFFDYCGPVIKERHHFYDDDILLVESAANRLWWRSEKGSRLVKSRDNVPGERSCNPSAL